MYFIMIEKNKQTDFNCSSSFVLSWVDNVTAET